MVVFLLSLAKKLRLVAQILQISVDMITANLATWTNMMQQKLLKI